MELSSNSNPLLELPTKKTNSLSTSNNVRKSKPKDTSRKNARRAKRRRATAGNADFNVNFSKIKISESNRVLRSRSKCSNSFCIENWSDVSQNAQTDAISNDHSYSKASRRSSKTTEPTTSSPPTAHFKVFIDLTSNEDSLCQCLEGSSKDHSWACRSNKIEIIDFDDLELSNSCYKDHNSNDPSVENRNFTAMPEQQTNEGANNTPMNPESPICPDSNSDRNQDQGKRSTSDHSDQNSNPKADSQKPPIKYGSHFNLAKNGSFLEQPHWMLQTAINANDVIEQPRLGSDETSPPPVYLDLDQNRIDPQTIIHLSRSSEEVATVSPINFPSGGCFQRLGVAASSSLTGPEYHTEVIPNSVTMEKDSRLHQSPQMPSDQLEWSSDSVQSPLTGFPNFQAVFAHKMASLKTSPPDTVPSPLVESNSFSTSGGSVERILSPSIPKQPSAQRNHHCISVSFEDTDNSVENLVPEFGQQPECRIHLVDTPPSFTRPSQTDLPHPRPPSDEDGADGAVTQQDAIEFDRSDMSYLKSACKPKRTRRTRVQMEICRQEIARTCIHRNKRNHRFTSGTGSHIFNRNFSMEYRRVHNMHPQDFVYSGLPTRYPPYLRQAAVQQQRYAQTYSVNETNLLGVALNGSDWSQPFDSFPSFSHGVTAFQSFEPLWTVSHGNSFSSTDAGHRQFYTPPPVPNPSLTWNQQVRSIQMQSAFGNVQPVPPTINSQLLATDRRPFTSWRLEQLSSNLMDASNIDSLNSMQFY